MVPRFFVIMACCWIIAFAGIKGGQALGLVERGPGSVYVEAPAWDNRSCLNRESDKLVELHSLDDQLTDDEIGTVASICAARQREYHERERPDN